MGANDGEVYVLRPDEAGDTDDEAAWVSPQPVSRVVLGAVADAADADVDDFDDLDAYVDRDDLAAVLDGDADEITFAVEDHDVTVDADGDVDVDPAE
ncbi:HalOD1 output domain-containing protein [Halorientalis halophila]|uniref:HalOD1 output domain-containing protein n=1 Tax=Halorientalis halophila TaxID=3108499 RepID=UPI00300BACBE